MTDRSEQRGVGTRSTGEAGSDVVDPVDCPPSWKDSFTPVGPAMKPLGLTLPKSHQGEPGWAMFPAGIYPACSKHGAMNKVSLDAQLWRCLNCNIGVEVV